jgi:hypothetical protein
MLNLTSSTSSAGAPNAPNAPPSGVSMPTMYGAKTPSTPSASSRAVAHGSSAPNMSAGRASVSSRSFPIRFPCINGGAVTFRSSSVLLCVSCGKDLR